MYFGCVIFYDKLHFHFHSEKLEKVVLCFLWKHCLKSVTNIEYFCHKVKPEREWYFFTSRRTKIESKTYLSCALQPFWIHKLPKYVLNLTSASHWIHSCVQLVFLRSHTLEVPDAQSLNHSGAPFHKTPQHFPHLRLICEGFFPRGAREGECWSSGRSQETVSHRQPVLACAPSSFSSSHFLLPSPSSPPPESQWSARPSSWPAPPWWASPRPLPACNNAELTPVGGCTTPPRRESGRPAGSSQTPSAGARPTPAAGTTRRRRRGARTAWSKSTTAFKEQQEELSLDALPCASTSPGLPFKTPSRDFFLFFFHITSSTWLVKICSLVNILAKAEFC